MTGLTQHAVAHRAGTLTRIWVSLTGLFMLIGLAISTEARGFDGQYEVYSAAPSAMSASTQAANTTRHNRQQRIPQTARTRRDRIATGVATHYDATGAGACSLTPTPGRNLFVAAMNADEFANAAVCGSYVQVTGPRGSVIVQITDLCPECRAGHLDLSREAFQQIAPLDSGRVGIQWHPVGPEIGGPIAFHFKAGSNAWWTAIQVRNHRNAVLSLEYQDGTGAWVPIPRTSYNYFVQDSAPMGHGPYNLRATDAHGQSVVTAGVPLQPNGVVLGAGQFPAAR